MDTKIRKIFVLLYPLNDFSKRMYEYIQGKLAELAPAYAVVETGGVGYLLHISLQTYSEIEGRSEVKLFTHFVVREDAQLFFGFSTKTERELFRQLISVSGVGGNTARMILSTYSPRELQSIITTENAVLLKNVKGLGLKNRPEDHRRAERQTHGPVRRRRRSAARRRQRRRRLRRSDGGPGDARLPQSGFGQGRPGHSQRATRHLGRRDRPHVAQTALNLQLHPETHTT